jgi:hypothetical protein
MTSDPDDDLPPLPEDVGVDVLFARMQDLQDAIARSADRIERTGTAVERYATGIDNRAGLLERQVHRFTVHSLWSFFGGILLAALALLAIGGVIGRQWGRQEGYDDAGTENAAASWGATDEGRWAYAFARTGDLAMIRNCTGKGWEITKGTCSPQAGPDRMVYGWHLIDRPVLPVRRKARKRH